MVFSFVVLTMLVFPASEGNANFSGMSSLVQVDGGQSPGRLKTGMASRFSAASGAFYAVHGP